MIRRQRIHAAQHALLLAVCVFVQMGCANLRLPAIDPYGRRVFLPRPAYTTVNPRPGRILPEPAFSAPPPPEECNPANAANIADNQYDDRLFPFGQREMPLLDRLFGPVQDDACDQASNQCDDRLLPLGQREMPLLDRLFGPVQDDACDQGVNPVPSAHAAQCVPVTTAGCVPACPSYDPCQAPYDPCQAPYDPCQAIYDPCQGVPCDPCLTTTIPQMQQVIVPQAQQPVPQAHQTVPQAQQPVPQAQQTTVAPLATAPAIANTAAPVTTPPRDIAYTTPETRGVHAARLQLNPARLVAPVGREVVLRVGLCGDDGYLIKKQPIEWSLSQDSVGSFVEVDEYRQPFWRRLFRRPATKKSAAYAIGRTSTAAQVITRSTADTSDDIWLAEGQTWISLTSASEGFSHVSAVAPTAAGWDERRQTATIHWVDGQWTFPPPSFSSAGTSRRITTNVVRATSGAPITGWIVRYVILDNTAAAGDQRVLDVPTDAVGNATVEVTPSTGQPGTTQIRNAAAPKPITGGLLSCSHSRFSRNDSWRRSSV